MDFKVEISNYNRKRIGFLNDRVTQYGATCNPHGTAQESAGSCICKSNVVGKFCDQCAAHSFNLVTNHEYKRGCLSCFCNGLEVQCQSSNLVYEALRADFATESHDWSIGDKFTKNVQALQLVNGGLEYSDFNIFRDREAFFIAPDKFKGNKLSSYGGNITIKLKYSTLSQDSCKFELRLSGSHVNIVYLSLENLIPDVVNEIVVPLYEDEFKRYGDNGKVNREHMLMALSDIKLIMIRANYSPDQYLINLNEFGIDVAQESNLDNSESRKAKSVEICECPVGYSGNSCENCAQGFKRSISGFYLGLCEPEF
ncbi:basement membrane-specific heparan sulfate proteoglycan core isoform X8 [Brachionus plicatilis]|uniref:Basement membrane-specific heparan sulfate proteoglycan core isoform X8 n=1 Tax=Brachionus plicatilis TaxID=10195 RepID=A0A3M7RTY6_BRAPC|nr:basement membrane-specific heparan sulfate proteoglycan core isoform X8 [Brachionus plicatilis]